MTDEVSIPLDICRAKIFAHAASAADGAALWGLLVSHRAPQCPLFPLPEIHAINELMTIEDALHKTELESAHLATKKKHNHLAYPKSTGQLDKGFGVKSCNRTFVKTDPVLLVSFRFQLFPCPLLNPAQLFACPAN